MTVATRAALIIFLSSISSTTYAQNFYNYGYGSGGLFATPDYASVQPGFNVEVDVLANDLSTENAAAKMELWQIHTEPLGGNAGIIWDENNRGKISYSAYTGFTGTDTIIYWLVDGIGNGALGKLTINVKAGQITAVPDFVQITAGTTTAIYPLKNDVHPSGRPIEILNVITRNGDAMMKIDPTGKPFIEYTPFSHFTGVDILLYQITDDLGQTSEEAQVSIAVVGKTPIARADNATVRAGQRVVIDVLLNDTDPEAQTPELVSIDMVPINAVATVQCTMGKCTIEYNAFSTFKAEDTFTYFMKAGYGPMATGTVTVRMQDDPPKAVADTFSISSKVTTTLNVLGNDTEPNGQKLTIKSVTAATQGLVSIVGGNSISFKPKTSARGADKFTYTITDGTNSSTATVTLDIKR